MGRPLYLTCAVEKTTSFGLLLPSAIKPFKRWALLVYETAEKAKSQKYDAIVHFWRKHTDRIHQCLDAGIILRRRDFVPLLHDAWITPVPNPLQEAQFHVRCRIRRAPACSHR